MEFFFPKYQFVDLFFRKLDYLFFFCYLFFFSLPGLKLWINLKEKFFMYI